MKKRIPRSTAIILLLVYFIALAALLYLPRLSYTLSATRAYNAALSLWQSAGPTAYIVVVGNNSPTQPTGGENTIRVQDGKAVAGHNPTCPDCTLEDFAPLTVEALFQRIQAECLHDFPFQLCNVGYDQTLGFPVRLDTYPYNQSGVERPSITVQSVEVLEP